MTALPQCYSGRHTATEEEEDQETPGKEIWRRKCGQRASGIAGDGAQDIARWRQGVCGLNSTGSDRA